LAKQKIEQAQQAQKMQYDRHETNLEKLRVGDRVMVYMPDQVQGKMRKLARPFHGPYRILSLTPTNAEVTLVDGPCEPSIFVSLDRVRQCYPELSDVSWTGGKKRRRGRNKRKTRPPPPPAESSQRQGPV